MTLKSKLRNFCQKLAQCLTCGNRITGKLEVDIDKDNKPDFTVELKEGEVTIAPSLERTKALKNLTIDTKIR